MTTDSKYYIPSIEEFHIGYEYLWYNTPHTLEFSDFQNRHCETTVLESINDNLDGHKIRVKFLDRSDIESLGWDLDQCVDKEYFFYHKDFSMITESNWCLVARNDFKIIEVYDTNDKYKIMPSFYMPIRNKSELKRLLMQIGILP